MMQADPLFGFAPGPGPASELPCERSAEGESGRCESAPWRLDVRIRGHWTASALCMTSVDALCEGLRQLELAGEIRVLSRSCLQSGRGRLVHSLRLAGAGSLRIAEGIAGTREETA